MKTSFSIISFYDPYGDLKSSRKQFNRKNYMSEKPLSEVKTIVEKYNDGKYYNAVDVAVVDGRSLLFLDFDKSYFLTSKAGPARYESIPGN